MSVGLILAAGSSQRLGQPKQLLPLHGQSLICHTVAQLSTSGMRKIVIVLGAYAEQVEASLGNNGYDHVELVFNDQWARGQSCSLMAGMRHVTRLPRRYQKVAIALCDQPLLTASHYRILDKALDDQTVDIAATRYPSGGGVPAAIRRSRWQELADSLAGDQGAKHWIRAQAPQLVRLIDAPLATLDVDTQSDLKRIATG